MILEKREKRQRLNTLATNGRNTVAKQKRMRALSEAAFYDENAPEQEEFGKDDSDWNIYLKMVLNCILLCSTVLGKRRSGKRRGA